MLRLLGGVNKAVPPCHCRGAAPCLGFELLGGLLDGGAFVGGLDGAEQDGLGGDLVDGPSFWLQRFWLAWHAGKYWFPGRLEMIGRTVSGIHILSWASSTAITCLCPGQSSRQRGVPARMRLPMRAGVRQSRPRPQLGP